MTSALSPCPRCGIRRQVHHGRGALCRDCRAVEPTWPEIPKEAALTLA